MGLARPERPFATEVAPTGLGGAAVPALDERQRGLAYQLMVASVMGVFSDNLRINVLTGHRFQSSDFKAHYTDLIGYVTGGILGLAQARSEPPA